MENQQSTSADVQIVSHNSIDLASHNEFVAQSIHQKIELMRYFSTTNHEWEDSLWENVQLKEGRSWGRFKHYLSFFKPLDWLRLTGFIIGFSILWIGKVVAYFLLYLFMFFAFLTVIAKTESTGWQSFSFFLVYTFSFVLFRFIWQKFLLIDKRQNPGNQSILKILWFKHSDSNSDKGLQPVVLCLLPEWLDSSLNPNQLTVTGEIDPLTLKKMWKRLSLFEKHVIMSDLGIAIDTDKYPSQSVEFVSSSLPYRDELIASIYQSQQSKMISKADGNKKTKSGLTASITATNESL
ncbi:hypothetical protein FFRU_040080 [Fructobacillus fructosus]|uniref:hypothetical protein n=1 Tax=Fructobacillus fructosus TaxID=1631 RepID=UPI0002195775|nr:hypothetical protein [Fructobacillus fructosus]KRN52756.1 hypothetical protein IV71_GL000915 [Fructobacillus fructosus KCTC 3544]GAP01074.1 hypothetical protein FFRU_040080 [Fructobacillus fructosus]